ncbi:autotransporter domain-containing protein [Acetobacter sp. LMG 1627]|uniref:Autotransporter domain-containing protein n=2 Tax=Acetobacter conturbans TaxID=1737472 RepID=A0ABX0JXP9_9PROT|nr:autotransporter domain-containing protein [Acetobacter conturbans]NHN88076.1 autotransporter domain-containing protein [Acetobacter conturbans]
MSVGTSLTLGQDATYRVTTTEKSSSLIDVTGTASINGATLAVVPAAQNAALTLGQHSTILTATDGVTGTFGTAEIGATTSENAFPFLAPSVSYAADSVSLDITRSAIQFTEAARTRNEYALASALDGMSPYAALISPVTQLNFANARTAFNALSGELHASLRTALIQDSYDLRNAVTDRLRAADCAPGAGANGMKTASYQHGERMKDDGQCHAGQAALWMQAYGEWSHNGGTAGTRGMSNSTGGFILGGDTPIADHWHLGGLFAYGHSGFSAGSAGNGHSNNASLGAYAGRNWGALGLRLGATYTWNILSTTRHIAFSGFTDRTSSNYLGGTAQTFADLGYRFNVLKTLSVEPFGNVAYVNQQTNSFAETGGAASLAGRGMNTGVTFATFGTRLATRMRIGETRIEPNITLAYRHAFGMMTPTVWQNILSGSSAFETAGIPLLQDAAVVNAGVRVSISDTTGFNVGYSGQYGARFSDSGLRGSFSLQF